MEKRRIQCSGFLLAELIVATALLGLIITGLAVSMDGFSMVNDCQWARQRCTAAAEAQLDSLAATGRLIEPPELKRLWPGVDVTVDKSAPAAPWDGLELIQITATAQAGPRKITVRLARYVGRASPLTGGDRGVRSVPVRASDGFPNAANHAWGSEETPYGLRRAQSSRVTTNATEGGQS
jgi:type II secretory pathway pseudopilin PulG